MTEIAYHIPALLPQVISGLDIKPDGTYVDVTFGGGGHTRGILAKLGDGGRLVSFDRDIQAVERGLASELGQDERWRVVYGNFCYLKNYLRYEGIEAGTVDGILADLGVSFHHFDDPERGFSFRFADSPLDMRMNQRGGRSAADLLAEATEEELADIFYLYGELKNARRIASAICRARVREDIRRVDQLLAIVEPLISPRQQKKELAQVFQALRIVVNGELDAIRAFMEQSLQMLAPGGRLAVITYHSLEDRLVKNFMKTGNFEGRDERDFYGRSLAPMRLLTSKPIVPDEQEITDNPRSRSAKLRIAEKTDGKE